MKKLLFIFIALSLTNIFGQDADSYYIELLRSDMKTERKAIVAATMKFTDAEADKFWPLYHEYEFELDELNDDRLAIIKDYAENYLKLTDKIAKELTNKNFENMKERIELREKYFEKFSDLLTPISAAKLMQIENEMQLIIDLQIANEIPFAERPEKLQQK